MRSFLALAALALTVGCASGGSSDPELGPSSVVSTATLAGGVDGVSAVNLVNSATASETMVQGSVDATWAALESVYASLEIPLAMRDEQKKMLGNNGFRTRRRVGSVPMYRALDCGGESGMPNAETYDITMDITSMVTATTDGGAKLQTLIQATGQRATGNNPNPVRCSSMGALEKKIGEMVQKIVAGK